MYTAKLGSSDGGMITDEVVVGQTHAQMIDFIEIRWYVFKANALGASYFSSQPAESKPN
jgi:hypothetical protein